MGTADLEHTYQAVIDDYDKAITLDSTFSFAYYNRGFVYCTMGNYKKAEEDFSAAAVYNSDFPEAYYNRGLIRILLNKKAEGCEDLSHAGEMGILDAYKVIKRYCYN